MKKFLAILLVLVAFSAGAQWYTTGATWQWVQTGYYDAGSAYAAATAKTGIKPAFVIVTDDPRIPYVVFSYEFADLWIGPANFRGYITDTDTAIAHYQYYRSITYHKAGMITIPEGLGIIWYTY